MTLRVGLICSAPISAPGSMAAYRDVLIAAMERFAPELKLELLTLGLSPSESHSRQRWHTLTMPLAARKAKTPDVWHVLDGSRAYIAFALRSAPVVITAHDIIPWLQAKGRFPGAPPTGLAARWLWRGNARAMHRAARVVCDSRSTADDLAKFFRLPSGAPVIGLPVRPTLAALARLPSTVERERDLVLHVGNNSFYKWREQVLQVFARLPPHCRLVMIGPPPTASLRAVVAGLALDQRVSFIDEPSDDALATYYRRAQLLLFPSRYEGFGWPVLEAMTFGLPLVASNRGSLPEVVGDACPMTDPNDVQRFAAQATELLTNDTLWRAASERALAQAQRFSMSGFANSMANVYRSVAMEARR